MSYSYLAGEHRHHPKEYSSLPYEEESYDQFMFYELARGIKAGDMLHNIFEFIDFTEKNPQNWQKVIATSLERFLPKENTEKNQQKLLEMVDTVLNTQLNTGTASFSLSDIDRSKRITELEFNFITQRFKIDALAALQNYLPEGFLIAHKQNEDIEGLLHGFIDLFFEHKGKYYILDWKSNFLGDRVTHYSPPLLAQAMSESNYHLQYIIYSLAAKKFLELKIKNFDYATQFGGVLYIFLRGVRQGKNTGIFSYKPSPALMAQLDALFSEKKSANLLNP